MASALEYVSETNNKDKKAKCLKIRSSVENIVHALLRVNTMSRRLPEIFCPPNEEENTPQIENSENENSELGNNLRFRN